MKLPSEMTDLERLLCFLHGAGYCGTRRIGKELARWEYDHDFANDSGSLITLLVGSGAAVTVTHVFRPDGSLFTIHGRRL